MREYDSALKSLLTRPSGSVLTALTGFKVDRWHNVELPAVRHRRADLLGETREGGLIHIELQSANHARMSRRMLEYSLAIERKFGRFPEQAVLYVGAAPLLMERFLKGPRLSFDCPILDVRELDSEPLLASSRLEDNVIAILTRLDNEREAVRRILAKIAMSEPGVRATAMSELMTLAGLRKLETVIERETEQMPILDDIMDHEVLGRERKRGIALGREKGLEEGLAEGLAKGLERGLAEGLAKGEQRVVLRLIGKRFGPVPVWARKRIEALSGPALEQVGLRLLDASSLEELLG